MTDMTRLTASASLFQMDYTLVGRIFNHMSYFICGTHHLLLYDYLRYFEPRSQMCNDAMIGKIRSQNPGAAIPPFAFKICGFQDDKADKMSCRADICCIKVASSCPFCSTSKSAVNNFI